MYIYFGVFFTVASSMFLGLICMHSKQYDSFGELAYLRGPVGDFFAPVEIMWWLFIFTPVWVGCGWITNIENTDVKLSLFRYNSIRKWWGKVIAEVLGLNLWYFVLFGLVYTMSINGLPDGKILLSLMLHSFAMVSMMLWLYIIFRKIVLSLAALIVFESVGKMFIMLGVAPSVMPLVWGMYGYSSECYSPGGYSWSLSAAIQIIYCLSVVILPLLQKKLILRSANI